MNEAEIKPFLSLKCSHLNCFFFVFLTFKQFCQSFKFYLNYSGHLIFHEQIKNQIKNLHGYHVFAKMRIKLKEISPEVPLQTRFQKELYQEAVSL